MLKILDKGPGPGRQLQPEILRKNVGQVWSRELQIFTEFQTLAFPSPRESPSSTF